MRIAMALVIMGALAISRPGYADPPAMPRYGAAWLDGLGLTGDQQSRVAELRTTSDRKVFALRDAMATKSSELRQLWSAQRPDRKAIQGKQAEMDQLRQQMQDARTEYRLAVLDVLTPAQRETLQARGGIGFGPGSGGPGWEGAGRAAWGGGCACRGGGAGPAL